MKRYLLTCYMLFLSTFLAILLLVTVVAGAEPEKLYGAWHYYGDTFEKDGTIYTVEDASDPSKILFYAGNNPFIIRLGECKNNYAKDEKYCVEKSAYENPDQYDSYIKYEAGDALYGYYITIYSIIPELKASREVSPKTPVIRERSTITVTLENTGEQDIKDVKYEEEIPETLSLMPIDGRKDKNKFIYETRIIPAGKKKVFQYGIIPEDYVSSTIKPTITYYYEDNEKNAEINAMTFSVASPITVSIELSPESANIGEPITYTISITNNEDEAMSLSASLELPQEAEIINKKGFKTGTTIDDELKPKETREYSVELRIPYTGDYSLKLSVLANIGGKSTKRYISSKVTVRADKLEPILQFSRPEITSGESATLRIYYKNNDQKNNYKDINAVVDCEGKKSLYAKEVVAGEKKLVEEMIIISPDVEKTETITCSLEGSYKTSAGEEFPLSAKATITVESKKEPYKISQKTNQTNASPGDTLKITVSVKNQKSHSAFTIIRDSFSEPMELISGKKEIELTLEPDIERQAYIYEARIPENTTSDNITIVTSALDKIRGEETDSKITIVLRKPKAPEKKNIESVNVTAETKKELPEKKGWLEKVWDWIVGVFG